MKRVAICRMGGRAHVRRPEKGKAMRTIKVLLLLTLLLPATGCKRITALFNGGRGYSEKLICHIDASTMEGKPVFSPDSRRIAYVAKVGEKRAVVVDGKEGKLYDEIGFTYFSIILDQMGTAQRGLSINRLQQRGESFHYGSEAPSVFSPDSQRVAYSAKVGEKWFAVVDGKEEESYDYIVDGPIFSPDSQHVAYSAEVGEKWFVVVNRQEWWPFPVTGEPYDFFSGLLFSPDSQRMAHAVRVGKWAVVEKWAVVVDGKEEKLYDRIGEESLTFSPDSRRVAYVAQDGSKSLVVVDGKEENTYDGIIRGESLFFSPDSRRIAYSGTVGWNPIVVVDGKMQKPYDAVGDPIFSPDSRQVAYLALVGEMRVVVVNGKEGKPYSGARDPIFSPDSRRVAYVAQDGWKSFVVVDGKEEKSYDGIGNPIFSPDSQRVAYRARVGEKWFVVVDLKEGKHYDGVGDGTLVFSPDSHRVAYVAAITPGHFRIRNYFVPASDETKWTAVVDGKEGKPYDGIPGSIVFDSVNQLHYLAQKNTAKDGKSYDIYLVGETLY